VVKKIRKVKKVGMEVIDEDPSMNIEVYLNQIDLDRIKLLLKHTYLVCWDEGQVIAYVIRITSYFLNNPIYFIQKNKTEYDKILPDFTCKKIKEEEKQNPLEKHSVEIYVFQQEKIREFAAKFEISINDAIRECIRLIFLLLERHLKGNKIIYKTKDYLEKEICFPTLLPDINKEEARERNLQNILKKVLLFYKIKNKAEIEGKEISEEAVIARKMFIALAFKLTEAKKIAAICIVKYLTILKERKALLKEIETNPELEQEFNNFLLQFDI